MHRRHIPRDLPLTLVRSWLITVFAFTSWGTIAHASVNLIEGGEAKAIIVVAANPTRSAQLAAKELQAHLKLLSRCNLEIVHDDAPLPSEMIPIYVGESRYTRELGLVSYRFAPHHWLVRIEPGYIALIGRDDPDTGDIAYDRLGTWEGFDANRPFHRLGTLYAAYEFLERYCGVRWYMVTDLGRVVPQKPTLTLEPDERQSATWTTYRRLGQAAWGPPGDLGDVDLRGIRRYRQWTSPRDTNLHVLRMRLACEPFGVNHSVVDYHTRFGDAHPEWFVDDNPSRMMQLRYSSADVVRQVANDALAYFSLPFSERRHGAPLSHAARHGAGDFFPVVPLDNRNYGKVTNPPAEPHRAKPHYRGTGVNSNYIFTWVNRVAQRVAETHPEGWISTIAYAGMFQPPDFNLASNVAVMVCMEDGWSEGSYGMQTLRQWRQRVSRLYTWEYHYATQRFPAVRPRRVADYITRLRHLGIEGMFMEKADRNPAVYHLDHYVESRLLSDADATVDAILDEYFKLFYGPAAAPMATFWNTFEQMSEDARHVARLASWGTAAKDGRLDTLRRSLAEAREAVGEQQPFADRLELMRVAVLGVIEPATAQAKAFLKSGTPTLKVTRFVESPVIDGQLDDPVWGAASTTPVFVTMMNQTPDVRTQASVGYDDTHLYVAFRCDEPRVEHMRLDQTRSSSAICTDESIEIVLDMTPETEDYVQVMVSAQGFVWSWWRHKYTSRTSPDLEIQAKTNIGDDKWTVELAIPWRHIVSEPPQPGDGWRLNLMRNRFAMENRERFDERIWTSWSPTFAWSWHIPDRFGHMMFE